MYAVAGFTVLYEFYAYPEHLRPRVSQMLVLPPFQRMGVGTALLETVYKRYRDDAKVVSITGALYDNYHFYSFKNTQFKSWR